MTLENGQVRVTSYPYVWDSTTLCYARMTQPGGGGGSTAVASTAVH